MTSSKRFSEPIGSGIIAECVGVCAYLSCPTFQPNGIIVSTPDRSGLVTYKFCGDRLLWVRRKKTPKIIATLSRFVLTYIKANEMCTNFNVPSAKNAQLKHHRKSKQEKKRNGTGREREWDRIRSHEKSTRYRDTAAVSHEEDLLHERRNSQREKNAGERRRGFFSSFFFFQRER